MRTSKKSMSHIQKRSNDGYISVQNKAPKKINPNRLVQKMSKTGAISKREETKTLRKNNEWDSVKERENFTRKFTNQRLQRV